MIKTFIQRWSPFFSQPVDSMEVSWVMGVSPVIILIFDWDFPWPTTISYGVPPWLWKLHFIFGFSHQPSSHPAMGVLPKKTSINSCGMFWWWNPQAPPSWNLRGTCRKPLGDDDSRGDSTEMSWWFLTQFGDFPWWFNLEISWDLYGDWSGFKSIFWG